LLTGAIAVTVTLEQLDQVLAEWKEKLRVVGENLIDLQGLTTYQRLVGYGGFPQVQLTGISAARITPALELMNDLFEHFDLLSQVVDKAFYLRRQLPRFFAPEAKILEIKQLLTGASIELPTVRTPLAKRELVTTAQTANALTPIQLLQVMTKAFQVARDIVLEVDNAWTHLEELIVNAQAEIQQQESLAKSFGVNALLELVEAKKMVSFLLQRIEKDPLGAKNDFVQQIEKPLFQVKSALHQVVIQQQQVKQKMANAHHLLQQLKEIHHHSLTAFSEAKEKVTDSNYIQSPLADELITALKEWLNRLETKLTEGLIKPVIVGVDNWSIKAKEYIKYEEEIFQGNKQALFTRKELRGRLDALQAKALAKGLIEDSLLVETSELAKKLLYMRPTPLNQASELLSRYEKRLNTCSKANC
jgi:hypothetical protein